MVEPKTAVRCDDGADGPGEHNADAPPAPLATPRTVIAFPLEVDASASPSDPGAEPRVLSRAVPAPPQAAVAPAASASVPELQNAGLPKAVLDKVVTDPSAYANGAAQASIAVAEAIAMLGTDPDRTMALAKEIWQQNLKQLNAISKIYGLAPLQLKFPYDT